MCSWMIFLMLCQYLSCVFIVDFNYSALYYSKWLECLPHHKTLCFFKAEAMMSFSYSCLLFKDLKTMLIQILYLIWGEMNKNAQVHFLYCLLVHCPLCEQEPFLCLSIFQSLKLKIVPDTVEAHLGLIYGIKS